MPIFFADAWLNLEMVKIAITVIYSYQNVLVKLLLSATSKLSEKFHNKLENMDFEAHFST